MSIEDTQTDVVDDKAEFVPVFEEPPPPRQRRRQSAIFTDEVVASMEKNPGKWIVVVPEATVSATTNAQNWAKRRPGFVVTSRTVVEDRTATKTPYRIYGKFDPTIVERETKELAARQAAQAKKPKKPKATPETTSEVSVPTE